MQPGLAVLPHCTAWHLASVTAMIVPLGGASVGPNMSCQNLHKCCQDLQQAQAMKGLREERICSRGRGTQLKRMPSSMQVGQTL